MRLSSTVLELAYIESFVKVANFNLPHLDLALPLGVTPFEFDLRRQKKKLKSLVYRVALFA